VLQGSLLGSGIGVVVLKPFAGLWGGGGAATVVLGARVGTEYRSKIL